ncbi:MAG: ABC transporter substrate-binding protein [Neomegalonema sp.]|nr:ABC transporter substrate-binding protein [Neomegalonema sp.]
MRRFVAALSATLLIAASLVAFTPSHAYEIEAEKRFTAPSGAAKHTLEVISSADLAVFAPLVKAFQSENPDIEVRYVVASSAELYRAIALEGAAFDVAISSAMDLQTKLANDGLARAWRSTATASLPSWARWRDFVFAFTQEPAVVVLSTKALAGAPPPRTRAELIELLRANPERFRGRVGGYDVRKSGLGYLFSTQDARRSESFWRLTEALGELGLRLYCCSGDMISDLETGKLVVGYNILGSYAARRVAARDDLVIAPLSDYTHIMLRTALIPVRAPNPDLAGVFVDFLIASRTRKVIAAKTGLTPLDPKALAAEPSLRPIVLGPGLLVYLDRLKRKAFLEVWTRTITAR